MGSSFLPILLNYLSWTLSQKKLKQVSSFISNSQPVSGSVGQQSKTKYKVSLANLCLKVDSTRTVA